MNQNENDKQNLEKTIIDLRQINLNQQDLILNDSEKFIKINFENFCKGKHVKYNFCFNFSMTKI